MDDTNNQNNPDNQHILPSDNVLPVGAAEVGQSGEAASGAVNEQTGGMAEPVEVQPPVTEPAWNVPAEPAVPTEEVPVVGQPVTAEQPSGLEWASAGVPGAVEPAVGVPEAVPAEMPPAADMSANMMPSPGFEQVTEVPPPQEMTPPPPPLEESLAPATAAPSILPKLMLILVVLGIVAGGVFLLPRLPFFSSGEAIDRLGGLVGRETATLTPTPTVAEALAEITATPTGIKAVSPTGFSAPSGWNSYHGNSYSMYYPSGWKQTTEKDFEAVFLGEKKDNFTPNLGVSRTTTNATLEAVVAEATRLQKKELPNYQAVQEERINVDGVPVVRKTFRWTEQESKVEVTQVQQSCLVETTLYTATATDLSKNFSATGPLFTKMMDSFIFIGASDGASPS